MSIAHATITAALERSRAKDVDEFFYSPLNRPGNRQVSDKELIDAVTDQAYRIGLRLDFVFNDQCRFTKVGNRL